MSLTVFEVRGIPATRRERIVAAIEAGGKCVLAPFEAWVTSDGRGKVRVARALTGRCYLRSMTGRGESRNA
jgi:hypothetical protein